MVAEREQRADRLALVRAARELDRALQVLARLGRVADPAEDAPEDPVRAAGRARLAEPLGQAQRLLGRVDREHVVAGVHVQPGGLLVEADELEARRPVLQQVRALLVVVERLLALALVPQAGADLAVQVAHPPQVLLRAVELEAFVPHLDRGVHAPHAQRDVALLLAYPRERRRVVRAADLARGPVVLERLRVRVEKRGGVARRLQEVERLGVERLELALGHARLLRQGGGAAVVLGEHGDDLVGPVARAGLDEAPHLEVLRAPHRLGQHPVRDVANQDVLEGVLRLAGELCAAARGDDEVLLLERHERVVQVEPRFARDAGHRSLPEGAPDHRRLLNELALVRLEGVEARGEQRLDGARQLRRLDRALLGEHARHLLGEERVAAGAGGHSLRRLLGLRVARQEAGHELARLVGAQRVEEDRRRAAAPAAPRGPVLEQLVAGEAQEQQRAADPLRQVLDQVEHAVVGPVDVLEREDERLLARAGLHRRAHGREERLAQLLRVLALHRSGVVGDLDAEEARDERRPALDRLALGLVVAQQEAARVVLDLLPRLLGAVLVEDPRVGANHLAERPVHDARAVREAASLAEGRGLLRKVLDALAELVQQARLAHARLADQRDEVRALLAGDPAVQRLHQRQLVVAADQRGGGARADAAGRLGRHQADGLPRRDRLGLALQVQRVERAVLDLARSGPVGAPAHGDGARATRRLQPRGDVDRVADDRVAVAHGTGEHLAGVDADSQLEARRVTAVRSELISSMAACMPSAARTARSSSSSWATGAPKIAMTLSPMYLSTVPPWRVTSSPSRLSALSTSAFTLSGSIPSDTAV